MNQHKIIIDSNPDGIMVNADIIMCNNIIFPGEYNPHNVRPWIIGNEYGVLAIAWADCEQDALDEAVDDGLMDECLVDDKEFTTTDKTEQSELAYLGNASEPFDLTNVWIKPIKLNKQNIKLMMAFAECRGAGSDKLSDI